MKLSKGKCAAVECELIIFTLPQVDAFEAEELQENL